MGTVNGAYRRKKMPRWTRRAVVLACATLVAISAIGRVSVGRAAENEIRFERSEVVIETATGTHNFQVELALAPRQRAQGLQDRRFMAEDAGMLFIFDDMAPIHMWMKNTLIALDMIFVDAEGRVINIAERTEPMSLDTVSSAGPAKGVLEVRAGTARRLGIRPGDRLVHRLLEAGASRAGTGR